MARDEGFRCRVKISATVITLNEEMNIAAALESLAWADEIIIVESGSTDRTAEIARGRAFRKHGHVRDAHCRAPNGSVVEGSDVENRRVVE